MASHRAARAQILQWPARTSADRHPAPKVLLVEAHADTCELYSLWLAQRAFVVTTARSGPDALAAVRRAAPDVIVLELMVPGGGVELVQALRAEPASRDAVLIVLTTQTGAALRQQLTDAGADVYLTKPCGAMQLGQMMVAAGRDRFRKVAPAPGVFSSSADVLQAAERAFAITERIERGAKPFPPITEFDLDRRH